MFLPCRAVTRMGSLTGLEWPRPSCNTKKKTKDQTIKLLSSNYFSVNHWSDSSTWASQLQPQAYTSPVLDKARMCSQPTATSSMNTPSRAGMICGRLWFFSMASGRPMRRSGKTQTLWAVRTSPKCTVKVSFMMKTKHVSCKLAKNKAKLWLSCTSYQENTISSKSNISSQWNVISNKSP